MVCRFKSSWCIFTKSRSSFLHGRRWSALFPPVDWKDRQHCCIPCSRVCVDTRLGSVYAPSEQLEANLSRQGIFVFPVDFVSLVDFAPLPEFKEAILLITEPRRKWVTLSWPCAERKACSYILAASDSLLLLLFAVDSKNAPKITNAMARISLACMEHKRRKWYSALLTSASCSITAKLSLTFGASATSSNPCLSAKTSAFW